MQNWILRLIYSKTFCLYLLRNVRYWRFFGRLGLSYSSDRLYSYARSRMYECYIMDIYDYNARLCEYYILDIYCYTEKTSISFPFTLNGLWSCWQFSFRFWTKWFSIWFKIERKTVTTIISHSMWKEMEI